MYISKQFDILIRFLQKLISHQSLTYVFLSIIFKMRRFLLFKKLKFLDEF